MSLSDRLQIIADQFIVMAGEGYENFDIAYEWLSEQLPEFADFEQVCMFLDLA